MSNEPFNDDIKPAEILAPGALEVMHRAEVDTQIATAHRFPRSIAAFFKRAESMATATPEIAASMEFAKPVGGQKVKGPSVRLAEIVAATYGNLRIQARIVSETETEVVAQGVAHDLESNVAHATEVAVSLLKRDGSKVTQDQVMTSRAAACAKARRNAIFLAVPIALFLPVIAAARKVAAGDQETLPQRRKALLDWLVGKGIKLSQIFGWLGIKDEADITLEHMADLIAARNTAKEDGESIAEVFGRPRADSRFSEDVKADGEKAAKA